MGFHSIIFLVNRCSSRLSKCPNYLIFFNVISLIVFFLSVNLSNSSLVWILQKPSACLFRRNIFCRIFHWKIENCHSICIFIIYVLHAYVTVGLIAILYDLNYYMLADNYLLVNISLFISMLHVQQQFFPLFLLLLYYLYLLLFKGI